MQGSERWHERLHGPGAPAAELLVGISAVPSPEILPGRAPDWDTPCPSTHHILMNYVFMRLFSTHLLSLPTRLSAPEWAARRAKGCLGAPALADFHLTDGA